MLHKPWNSKGEMPFCFPRSSIKCQGHTVQDITDFDPNWAFPDYRPVAAFKSLRFALLKIASWFSRGQWVKYPRYIKPSRRQPRHHRWNLGLQTCLGTEMLKKVRKTYRSSVILITNGPGSQMRVTRQFYSCHCFQVPPHIEQVWFTLWSDDLIIAWVILQSGSLNNACVLECLL